MRPAILGFLTPDNLTAIYDFYGLSDGSRQQYCKEYHLSQDAWSEKTSGPAPVRDTCGSDRVGFFGYTCGGSTSGPTPGKDCDRYGQAGDSWSSMQDMLQTTMRLAVKEVGRLVYTFGGNDGGYTATCDAYNPVANSWANKGSMNVARGYLAGSRMGGKLYSTCGTSSGEQYMDDHEEYNAAADLWTTKTDYPASNRFGISAFGAAGKIVVCFGNTGTQSTSNRVYDPGGDSWSSKTPGSIARYYAGAAAADKGGYVIGGAGGGGKDINEAYDVFSDSWTTMEPAPEDVSSQGVSAL